MLETAGDVPLFATIGVTKIVKTGRKATVSPEAKPRNVLRLKSLAQFRIAGPLPIEQLLFHPSAAAVRRVPISRSVTSSYRAQKAKAEYGLVAFF